MGEEIGLEAPEKETGFLFGWGGWLYRFGGSDWSLVNSSGRLGHGGLGGGSLFGGGGRGGHYRRDN